MNMKQKRTYMLIGCLFTLAGFVISNLTNTPTQAQDEKKAVFDKVVCKELEIVNAAGKRFVYIGSLDVFAGVIATFNAAGEVRAYIGSSDDKKGGYMSIRNAAGKEVVGIGTTVDNNGVMSIRNADGRRLVNIRSSDDGKSGHMSIFNAAGKPLVGIGPEEGRPNDGLINIYNHKGEWRSYRAD